MLDLEGFKLLYVDLRFDGIFNSEFMILKYSRQDEGCREYYFDIFVVVRLINNLKNKCEIFGLRVLVENEELQQLDRGCEDIFDYNGQVIRFFFLDDLLVEGWIGGLNKSVK